MTVGQVTSDSTKQDVVKGSVNDVDHEPSQEATVSDSLNANSNLVPATDEQVVNDEEQNISLSQDESLKSTAIVEHLTDNNKKASHDDTISQQITTNKKNAEQQSNVKQKKLDSSMRMRLIVIILTSLCPVICFMSRVNLSIAIDSMVLDSNERVSAEDGDYTPEVPPSTDVPASTQSQSYGKTYNWSSFEKSFSVGSFFITYALFQIPLTRFSESYGAKLVLSAAGIVSALMSLLAPWAASQGSTVFILCRMLLGFSQAAYHPSMYVLYSKWLPENENLRALPLLYIGTYLGIIITSQITGYFCSSPSYGWEWSFYICGIICGLWSLVFVVLVSSTPGANCLISASELEYIETKLSEERNRKQKKSIVADANATNFDNVHITANGVDIESKAATEPINKNKNHQIKQIPDEDNKKKPQLDWNKVIRNKPVWAIIIAFVSSTWAFSIFMVVTPTYLDKALNVAPMSRGNINSVIWSLASISGFVVGLLSTRMVNKRAFNLSRTQIRKLFQCSSLFLQVCCLFIMPFVDSLSSVVFLLLFHAAAMSLINGGEVQVPAEISAQFSGTIYALANSFGTATGFIVPMVQSALVINDKSPQGWRSFYFTSAAIIAIGAFLFALLGDTSPQDLSKRNNAELEFELGKTKTNCVEIESK